MSFRLMTYNILNGGKGRRELITRVIRVSNPDIVLLQELESPVLLKELPESRAESLQENQA